MKVALDAGSGPGSRVADWFPPFEWRVLRLDLDPAVNPDLVGDIRDIPLPDGSVDGVLCSHTLEHLPEREVPKALQAFRRILRPEGRLVVLVPDLEGVALYIAEDSREDGLTDVLYESPAGPIRPLDVIYGHQGYAAAQPLYEHKTGFSARSLNRVLAQAGFSGHVEVQTEAFQLVAVCQSPAHVREPVAS